MSDYATALGAKLRTVRRRQGLSLHGVEQKSGGRWKAALVGSYERGDRAITAQTLVELVDFYGVPVTELLPDSRATSGSRTPRKIIINMERLQQVPADTAGPLARFAAAIQSQRDNVDGKILALRSDDLRPLSIMYGMRPDELTDHLKNWGLLLP